MEDIELEIRNNLLKLGFSDLIELALSKGERMEAENSDYYRPNWFDWYNDNTERCAVCLAGMVVAAPLRSNGILVYQQLRGGLGRIMASIECVRKGRYFYGFREFDSMKFDRGPKEVEQLKCELDALPFEPMDFHDWKSFNRAKDFLRHEIIPRLKELGI